MGHRRIYNNKTKRSLNDENQYLEQKKLFLTQAKLSLTKRLIWGKLLPNEAINRLSLLSHANASTSMGVFSQSSSCCKISLRSCSIPHSAPSTVTIGFYLFFSSNKARNYTFILYINAYSASKF
jgi:hypothetical protein